MTITICPRCQRRILHDPNSDDVVHECNSGNSVLDEEDVTVVGDWVDFTGSGTVNNVLTQGIENTLEGTKAGIEGQRKQNTTDRGARASTHRQRQHFEFIQLQGGTC